MKIMARDQGLDSFPASACEVKSLPLPIVLFGCVPCKDFPPFPGISHDFPAFPRYPPARIKRPGCEAKFRARLESGRAGASRTSYGRPLSRWERVGVMVRSMARTVHGGTEALQSFFSAPAWIAWRKEEKILPCFRIRQQGECVRNTRHESRLFSPSGPPCPPSSHGFPIHCCPLLPTIARLSCRQAAAARNGPAFPGFLAARSRFACPR